MEYNFRRINSILACPKCKGDVHPRKASLWCERCNVSYPILNNIPNFLSSPATDAEVEELNWVAGKTVFSQRKTALREKQEEASSPNQAHIFAHEKARKALARLIERISKTLEVK